MGRRILVDASNRVMAEIIAVAGDVRHNGLTSEPAPSVFLLHAQTPGYITNLVVRTTGEPSAQAAAVRRAIREVDPTQAVSAVKHHGSVRRRRARPPAHVRGPGACFAALAGTLAAIGIYGLIAYVVTQRTHEIGIRLALGASRGDVFRAMFGQGARLTATGLVVGLLAAGRLRGVVAPLLFGIAPVDPASYLLAAAGFAAVALAAAAFRPDAPHVSNP